jgi:hypothetical protein
MALDDNLKCQLISEMAGIQMVMTLYLRDIDGVQSEEQTLTDANSAVLVVAQNLTPLLSNQLEYSCTVAQIIDASSSPAQIAFISEVGADLNDSHPTTQAAILRYYDDEYFQTNTTYHWKIAGIPENKSYRGRLTPAYINAWQTLITLLENPLGIVGGAAHFRVVAPKSYEVELPALDPARPSCNNFVLNPILKKQRSRQTRLCGTNP